MSKLPKTFKLYVIHRWQKHIIRVSLQLMKSNPELFIFYLFIFFLINAPCSSIEKAAVWTAGVRHGGGPGLSLQVLESPGEPELLSREVAGWHTNPVKVNSFWHQSHFWFCCIRTLLESESDVAHLNTSCEVQNWMYRRLREGFNLFWPVYSCEAKVWIFSP